MINFRYGLIALGALAVAALFGSQIATLEKIKDTGQTVLLDLRPADPRAFMMGDFMTLRFSEERASTIREKNIAPAGSFVLSLDSNNVGTVKRLYAGETLGDDEVIINYTRRKRGYNFGAPRYYFQNGTAETYEPARYGVFKVSPSGRAILTALAADNFTIIEAPKKKRP